jgi:CelD/BcsL family acetyltransferase involved in cellulose biosynthesis
LHQRRRVSLGQPGCFGDATFGTFLRDASTEFLRLGKLRLVLVERGEVALGSLLMLLGDETSYAYQMGTNPDFLADSPGWLVVCASVAAGIEQHETALDLLRGDESYKSRMGGVSRSMLQVRVVPARLRAQLRHTAWLTRAALKSWVKSGLQAAGLVVPSGGST